MKVVKSRVRFGQIGTLIALDYIATIGETWWKVSFADGQTGLYPANELRKV